MKTLILRNFCEIIFTKESIKVLNWQNVISVHMIMIFFYLLFFPHFSGFREKKSKSEKSEKRDREKKDDKKSPKVHESDVNENEIEVIEVKIAKPPKRKVSSDSGPDEPKLPAEEVQALVKDLLKDLVYNAIDSIGINHS